MTKLPELLRDSLALSGPDPLWVERLSASASARLYRADEIITQAGDRWPYLLLVAEGRVVAAKESGEGRSLIVAEIGAGELFWGLAFFEDDLPNPVTLQCRGDCRLYLWSREAVLPLLVAHGDLTWGLARAMARRMQRAGEVIEGLAFQPIAGRLARLLLEQIPPGRQSMPRSLTLDDLAARLGTTREVVFRTLYRLADRSLISVTRTEFILTDREGLSRLAEAG